MTREQITFRRDMLRVAQDCATKALEARREARRCAVAAFLVSGVDLILAAALIAKGHPFWGAVMVAGALTFWMCGFERLDTGEANSTEFLSLREEALDDMAEILAFMELGGGMDASHFNFESEGDEDL